MYSHSLFSYDMKTFWPITIFLSSSNRLYYSHVLLFAFVETYAFVYLSMYIYQVSRVYIIY